MKVKLIAYTPNPEQVLMNAAAECYQTEPKIGIVKSCIKRGHTSVIEHVSFIFQIDEISRACSHQLVRHRIASFTQKSQRYVNESQFEYVTPLTINNNEEALDYYYCVMNAIQQAYDVLLSYGIPKEDARYVLPNACTTSLTLTMNLRALLNFWKLRTDKHAQWEIRELANRMLELVLDVLPNLKESILEVIND
jgi:thymidylate synthase (FAD)